jgi:iron only hydrogenase large subunit-like protein
LLPHLATVKSPQQIMGSLIKTIYADHENIKPANIYTVGIMPCTSKKFEASRPEMTHKGITDVDTVITTRELVKLIKMNGINVSTIEAEPPDQLLTGMGSAGKLVGVTGGTAEAALRTFYYKLTGAELPNPNLATLRGFESLKELTLKMGKMKFNTAVVNGMATIQPIMDDIIKGRSPYHYIEVMACPGGCIAGGGQPLRQREESLKNRMKNIYDLDEKELIRMAHKNPQIVDLYKSYINNSSHPEYAEIFHTRFFKRNSLK